jgi:hypothetical protein
MLVNLSTNKIIHPTNVYCFCVPGSVKNASNMIVMPKLLFPSIFPVTEPDNNKVKQQVLEFEAVNYV